VSDIPITDINQAELMANTARNQGAAAAPAEAPKTPVTAAPAERNVNGVKMTEAQYQYYINEAKPGLSPAQAIEEMNAKAAMPAAPVAETPKAPAPPPEAAPKAAVPPKKPKHDQPPGTGKGDNWIYNLGGADLYKDVIRTQNNGKPFGLDQKGAIAATQKYANEVGRYKPFKKGAPSINIKEMEAARPKSGNFGKLPLSAVPPPSLRPAPQLGGGAGAMMRGIGDPLQLKQ
jgi:hypothetical protein